MIAKGADMAVVEMTKRTDGSKTAEVGVVPVRARDLRNRVETLRASVEVARAEVTKREAQWGALADREQVLGPRPAFSAVSEVSILRDELEAARAELAVEEERLARAEAELAKFDDPARRRQVERQRAAFDARKEARQEKLGETQAAFVRAVGLLKEYLDMQPEAAEAFGVPGWGPGMGMVASVQADKVRMGARLGEMLGGWLDWKAFAHAAGNGTRDPRTWRDQDEVFVYAKLDLDEYE